jgi:hypothetical protein
VCIISLFSYCVCFGVFWFKWGCGYITDPLGGGIEKQVTVYVPSKNAPAMCTVRWNLNIVCYSENIVKVGL